MIHLLAPDLYLDSFQDLNLDFLRARGILGIIIDLDNTLVEWNKAGRASTAVSAWFQQVRDKGFNACIVSNNHLDRVSEYVAELDIPAIHNAGKPRRRPFRRAMDLMGTTPAQTAVVGDQIFTDVLGGNRLGMFTVLVVPVSPREFISTRLVRQIERLVLRSLARRGLIGTPFDRWESRARSEGSREQAFEYLPPDGSPKD